MELFHPTYTSGQIIAIFYRRLVTPNGGKFSKGTYPPNTRMIQV